MIKFPLNSNARAQLLDRKYAVVHSVVIDPVQQRVLSFILKDANEQKWVVPLKDVIDAQDDLVRLRITEGEFNQLPRFDESQYIQGSDTENDFFKAEKSETRPIYFTPSTSSETTATLDKDLVLLRGAYVEASDGFIGTIEEISIDPKSGAATEIVIHTEGREKHEIVLPVSLIDRAQVDTVYLKMKKEDFESLPSVPVKYTKAGKIRYQMVAVVYDTVEGAKDAHKQWKKVWSKQSTRFIYSAAILERDQEGNFSFSESIDLDKRHGRLFGALTGGLVGLAGGPIGLVVGALAGAGVGGLTADKVDRGLSNEFLETFAQNLKPGTSALIMLVDREGVPTLQSSLGPLKGVLVREDLTEDMLKKYAGEKSDD